MDKTKLDDMKKKLTPEQYNVCFLKGTEPPFSGKYTDNHEAGMYAWPAGRNYLKAIQNLIPGTCLPAGRPAGQASGIEWRGVI